MVSFGLVSLMANSRVNLINRVPKVQLPKPRLAHAGYPESRISLVGLVLALNQCLRLCVCVPVSAYNTFASPASPGLLHHLPCLPPLCHKHQHQQLPASGRARLLSGRVRARPFLSS